MLKGSIKLQDKDKSNIVNWWSNKNSAKDTLLGKDNMPIASLSIAKKIYCNKYVVIWEGTLK